MASGVTRERIAETRDALDNALAELEPLVRRVREVLAATSVPSELEVYGAGAMLHAYYNQVEQLFERIARDFNSAPPEGAEWHRRLLDAMAQERPALRPAVISRGTRDTLREYLGFRHVFRRLYILNLRWERVRELLAGLEPAHRSLVADLVSFRDTLDALWRELGSVDEPPARG